MATAGLISPNTPYHSQHQPSYPSAGYHSSRTPPAPLGLVLPGDPRRTSDDRQTGSYRQSLPSIQEVIGKGSTGSYQTAAQPPTSIVLQNLPSPFTGDRQPSPRVMQHPPSSSSTYNQRPEPITTVPNILRPPLSSRSQVVDVHPSPPLSLEPQHVGLSSSTPVHQQQQQQQQQHLLQDQQQSPRLQPQPVHSGHLAYHQPQREPNLQHEDSSSQPNKTFPHASGQHSFPPQPLPQQNLPPLSSSYSVSPRHSGLSSLPSPFEAQQQTPFQEASHDYGHNRTRYDQTVSRHFEAWSYAEYLARIGSNARTIYNFAEAFGSIAREEHGPQPIPGRMPGDREVRDMINNADWLKTMLENLRGMVQQTVNEHGTSSNRQKPSTFEDMESAVYNESMAKPYTVNEVKKRRGRAAPPGRCHSCNRIDTPEWRRGPDGARTLCNACGLHYAKLERKKQLENRGIRPKHSDERH